MKRNYISILAVLILIWLLGLAEMSLAVEGTWTQKADMPMARCGLATSVVDGKIYAMGGMSANGFHKGTVISGMKRSPKTQ